MRQAKTHAYRTTILIVILLGSLLYVGCGGAGTTQSQQQPGLTSSNGSVTASSVPYEKNVDFDLSSSTSISPQATFTLSNQGNDAIVMPAMVVSGNSALNRSSILYPLQSLKDEQFAMATWQFMVKNTQHYCEAGAPGDPNDLTIEPMRLLNGFGGMCCDQGTRVLNWLWQGAGYKARLVTMDFHTVPEIYYAGAWHMFDSDHMVYYLQLDNKTVASVADIIANPYLVERTADADGNDPSGYSAQLMASQYAASTPSYSTNDYSVQQTYTLQPGQSFSINYANIVPVFQGAFAEPFIPPAATGSFDWNLDYANSGWGSLTTSNSGVTTFNSNSSVFLTNSTHSPGYVIYALSSPFPVISLQVNGLVNLESSNAMVNAYFSTDGVTWSTAFPLNSAIGTPTQTSADLSSVAAGQYTYFVKLELAGDSLNTAQVANVHIVTEFQDSIYVFPNLVPGQINHLTYQDWSASTADHNVTISLTGQ